MTVLTSDAGECELLLLVFFLGEVVVVPTVLSGCGLVGLVGLVEIVEPIL